MHKNRTQINLSAYLLILPFLTFSASCTYAAEFSNSREDIVAKLLADPNAAIGEGEFVVKSISLNGSQAPATEKVKALTEAAELGSSKAFQAIERSEEAPRVNLVIEFDFNSDTIRQSSIAVLNEVAEALADSRFNGKALAINGHTDAVGDENYNYDLSFRRSKSVRSYLKNSGLGQKVKLDVRGFGESIPISSNDTENGRQENRRVEIEMLL